MRCSGDADDSRDRTSGALTPPQFRLPTQSLRRYDRARLAIDVPWSRCRTQKCLIRYMYMIEKKIRPDTGVVLYKYVMSKG
eukprot:3194695-Amphidinium_carterae.1